MKAREKKKLRAILGFQNLVICQKYSLKEHIFFLGLTEKKKKKKLGTGGREKNGFKTYHLPQWSDHRIKRGKIIYKTSFICLHVLEMCLDTVLHALTYSTFYVVNFDCTSFPSEGIHHSMKSCMKLHEKQKQIPPNQKKKKNPQENSQAVNFENLKGTTEQDT